VDPRHDARTALAPWAAADIDDLLQVRPARRPLVSATRFSLWRVPGRKALVHLDDESILVAHAGARWLRARLEHGLVDGAACRCAVPLTSGLRGLRTRFESESRQLEGVPEPGRARAVTRAGLLHLRALQAIDASNDGASHRDIATALFGPEAVRTRWSADGELRAQLRHVLARAEEMLRGGYLRLAGIAPWAPDG
jgi:hypothetical protein